MILDLPSGKLQISVLKDKELIIGVLEQGSATVEDLLSTLQAGGIVNGIHRESLEKLAEGYSGQLPLATSSIDIELVQFNVDFAQNLFNENEDPYTLLTSLHNLEISNMVMEGDRLLTITRSSKRILTRPDGKRIVLSDAGMGEIHHFCGANVKANPKGNTISATIDGIAQVTTRGRVSVYPFEVYNNVGKIHGNISTQHALLVQGDITGGAKISTQASLIVRGMIRSASIHCSGDLDCKDGLENLMQSDEGDVRVEQNLRTSSIKHFNAWVGAKCLVSRIIDQANLEIMDTLITPRISDSRVAVCNQLITYNVVRDSVLMLGPGAVEDPFITRFEQFHLQHSRKHHDLHLNLEGQQAYLDQLRQKAILILQRLKNEGKSGMVGNVLKRYVTTMKENVKVFRNTLDELTQIEDVVKQERAELAYNASLMKSFENPCILVAGRLESGTRIIGPNESKILEKSMNNIEITLDKNTGKLIFTQLGKA